MGANHGFCDSSLSFFAVQSLQYVVCAAPRTTNLPARPSITGSLLLLPLHRNRCPCRRPRCCFIPARSRCMQRNIHNPIHLATNKHRTTPLHGQHCRPTGRSATASGAATLSSRLAAAVRNGSEEHRSPRSVLQPVDQPRALPPESLLHGVTPAAMWTSKLGPNYSVDDIRKNDKKSHAELQRIRWRPDNAKCADCSNTPTVWAIVNHGVFVCLRCASVHRSLGTHISKPVSYTHLTLPTILLV